MADAQKSEKIPLKLRLKAWWEGYDVNEMKDRLKKDGPEEDASGGEPSADDEGTPQAVPAPKAAVSESADRLSGNLAVLPWDDTRMEVSQLVWGQGYCGPGGPEHIKAMSKLLAMTPEMSAAVIGAGLGGPCRVMAEEFGVWITGYEESPELAKKGMSISTMAGLGKKAEISSYDPTAEDPFNRRFDRAFAKEALYTVKDKTNLISKMYEKLKDDALFLITDYTLSGPEVLEDDNVQKWLKQEINRPYPVTAEMMAALLEKAGFMIRVNEDISDLYIELIAKSWANADKIAAVLASDNGENCPEIGVLMKEASFWSLRAKLLREKKVHVWRLLAYKPAEN
ncbi:methyltransferase domain-containing protein [Emcibacter sp.]|uniref:methyltransferase domain-containing protein n=1 Tax=Emcibacter sp. TaxID=1979954 RepID=UPI002AA6D2D1|nr:methyltransferase domain-containing protein [Emcibacter sp.]